MSEQVKKTDGGPAFPWGDHGTHLGGISQRDYFASAALQGLLVNAGRNGLNIDDHAGVAEIAFSFADAMLEARNV